MENLNKTEELVLDAEAIARVRRIVLGSTFKGEGAESVVAALGLLSFMQSAIMDQLNNPGE